MSDTEHVALIGLKTYEVNGYLTDGKMPQQRSQYRSMLEDILKRIESRLVAVGLDATTASLRANLSEDAIRNIRRTVKRNKEDASVNSYTLLQLAPVLQTTASWLLEGVDCGPANLAPSMARLWIALTQMADTPPELQDRVADFAEYQLASYARSLDTATKPVS